ncbi:MAG: REP-associated tyrosine transposase [Chloroflexota bacterium]|nr:MAG: IS200/IS605 family transposase [Chloroflexota bacterium]
MWIRDHREVDLYAYCLMPDHLHLLLKLRTNRWTLGDVIGSLKSFTTERSWQLGHEGALWQDRFHDHILRRSEDGDETAAYILNNPVRKGLVKDRDDYAYSGTPDPM